MRWVGLKFHIYPEISLDDSGERDARRLILVDPDRYFSEISGFLRLNEAGDTLILGQHDELQTAMFNLPAKMDMRYMSIAHDGDALTFKTLVSDTDIHISPVMRKDSAERIVQRRMQKLREIRTIYGGPIELLPPLEAIATLGAVNDILEEEAYRPLDERGKPGGVLKLKSDLIPIVVGDLHA